MKKFSLRLAALLSVVLLVTFILTDSKTKSIEHRTDTHDVVSNHAKIQQADSEPTIGSPAGNFSTNVTKSDISSREEIVKKTATSVHLKRTTIARKPASGRLVRKIETLSKDPASGKSQSVTSIEALADHVMALPQAGVELEEIEEQLTLAGLHIVGRETESYVLVAVDEPEKIDSHPATLKKVNDALSGLGISEPDYLYYPATSPNDPYFDDGRLWGLENVQNPAGEHNIDAVAAWQLRSNASDVIVAVTDTGIRVTHEDLVGNLWVNSGETAGDGIDNDANGIIDDVNGLNAIGMNGDLSDDSGHGTHVAGTIGAQGNNDTGTVGVCWDVQLMGLRFIGPDGGSSSDAVKVINYARENGADIINASWGGGGKSSAIRNAVLQCRNEGILFVAAAGNSFSNIDETPFFPASIDLDNVITVAASDRKDRLAGFSSFGRYTVDLAAPGTDIISTFSGSDDDYKPSNGTSMAAPHVSGALALARAYFPGDSAADLKTRLLSSCDQVPDLEAVTLTGGRLNLRRFLAESSLIPAHDDLDNALAIEGSYAFWRGRNDRATREANEDVFSQPGTGGRSLWFSWIPPYSESTSFAFSGDESGVNFILFSQDGTGALHPVISASSEPGIEEQVQFDAEGGAEYLILLDTPLANPSSVSFRLYLRPENDNFPDAVELAPEGFDEMVNNRGATTELFEEGLESGPFPGFHSLWWSWIPAETNNFLITTQGSQIDTILDIYSLPDGGETSDLSLLSRNDDIGFLDQSSAISINLEAGKQYYLRVQSVHEDRAGKIYLQGRPVAEPEITFQPQSLSLSLGATGSFEVGATGDFLSYQWLLNGSPIPGADDATFQIRGISLAQYGGYSVRISNPVGVVVSDVADLKEVRTPPVINWISDPQVGGIGNSLRLAVGAGGSRPLSYQWSKDGEVLPGQTGSSISLLLDDESKGGLYHVSISNDQGSITSEEVTVGVFDNPLQNWQSINTRALGAEIKALEFADGHFVAVSILSEGFLVRSSTDGQNWKSTFLEIPGGNWSSTYQEASLAYGNGMWLLAAPSSSPGGLRDLLFYRSDDLETWETLVVDSSHLNNYTEQHPIVFHDGYFYASLTHRVIKSADGEIWNFVSVDGEILMAHLFESSPIGLLAIREDQESGALLDTAGVWRSFDTGPFRAAWIKWYQGRFIAQTSNHFFMTSVDGINWTQEEGERSYGTQDTVLETTDQLVAFSAGLYTTAADGINWEPRTPLWNSITPSVVAGSEGSFVIGTTGGHLIHGNDVETVTYPESEFPLANTSDEIAVGGGRFVIPFYSGGLVSSDGIQWKSEKFYNSDSTDLINTPATIFGTQSGLWLGKIFAGSPDAAFRAEFSSSLFTPDSFTGIAGERLTKIHDGPLGLIAEVHKFSAGTIYGLTRSVDEGSTWTEIPLPPGLQNPSHYDIWINEENGVYYFGRDGVRSYATTDLENWTEIPFFINSPNIAFAKGKYWWLSPIGQGMRTSDDGLTWSEPTHTTPTSSYFRKMKSLDDTLVIMEANGSIYISDDGLSLSNAGIPFRVEDFEILDDTVVVLGSKKEIARATLAPRHNPRVEILSPREEAEVLARSISVEIEAYDPGGETAPVVTLFIDGSEFGTANETPYRFALPILDAGNHHLRAVAENSNGGTSSDEVVFTVTNLSRSINGQGLTFEPSVIKSYNGMFFAWDYSITGKVAMSPDGSSWQEISFPVGVQEIKDMIFSNGIILLDAEMADRSKKFLVSDDGLGWTVVEKPFDRLYVYPNDSGFYASDIREHFSSSDGVNWKRIGTVGEIPGDNHIVGDPDHVLYTVSSGFPENTLWASFNGGRSWVNTASGNFADPFYVDGVVFVRQFSPDVTVGVSSDGTNFTWIENPGDVYHAGGRFFASGGFPNSNLKTSLDGISWVDIESSVELSNITFQPSIGYLASVGFFDQDPLSSNLYWSQDGITWSSLGAPAPDNLPDPRYFHTAGGLLAKTTQGGYFRLDGDTRTWIRLTQDDYQSLTPLITSFRTTDDGRIYGRGRGGWFAESTDEGTIWRRPSGVTWPASSIGVKGNEVILYKSQEDSYFLSSNGNPFEEIDLILGIDDGRRIDIWGIAPVNGQWLLSGDAGKFYQSTDGRTWSEVEPTGLPAGRDGFTIDPVPGGIWGSYGSGLETSHVFSADGINWVDIVTPFGDFSFNDIEQILSDGDDIIINHENKIWRTTDRVNFTQIPDPINNNFTTIFKLHIYQGTLLASNRGKIYQTTDDLNWEVLKDLGEDSFSWSNPAPMVSVGNQILVQTEQGIVRFTKDPEDEVDLLVANLEVEAKDYGVAEQLDFTFNLSRNLEFGELEGEVEVEVFLTRDRFNGNADDIPLETFSLGWPEGAIDTFSVMRQITLPETIEAGHFHLGIKLDPEGTLRDPFFANGITLTASTPIHIPAFVLSLSTNGIGSIDLNQTGSVFPKGSQVALSAVGGGNSRFAGWNGDVIGGVSDITVLMDRDINLEARFLDFSELRIDIRGGGTVNPGDNITSHSVGAEVNLSATPAPGWTFGGWSGDLVTANTETTIALPTSKRVLATFTLNYSDWVATHFLEGAPEESKEKSADSDGDDRTNAEEWLHGSDPNDPSSTGILEGGVRGQWLVLVFERQNVGIPGASVIAEGSRDYHTWNSSQVQQRVIRSTNGVDTIEARMPLSEGAKGFLRLKYQVPE